MGMSHLLNLQGQPFLLLLMGAILRKSGILTGDAKGTLTDLVIYLILPCNIINSFRIEFNLEILRNFMVVILVAVAIQVFCMFLSKVLYRKEPLGRRKVLQYATLVSNAGFMGNPIAEGVFGAGGLMYASIYLIPQRIVMWSAGLACFTESEDRKTVIRKIVTHPCIVAVYIGLLLMFTQMELPAFLSTTIRSLGACTTSISMLLIGTILADVDLRDMVSIPVLKYTAIRLFVIPLAAYIGCRMFRVDSLVAGVAVLLAAMPAGSTTAILASKYDGDYEFATKCVVFSTLMTLVSVPLWCSVL